MGPGTGTCTGEEGGISHRNDWMAAWAVRKRGMVQSGSGGGSGTWHEWGAWMPRLWAEQWCVRATMRSRWRHKQQLTFWRSRVARVMPYDSFFLCRSGAWSVVGGCGRTGWIMTESTWSDGLSVSGAHTRRRYPDGRPKTMSGMDRCNGRTPAEGRRWIWCCSRSCVWAAEVTTPRATDLLFIFT